MPDRGWIRTVSPEWVSTISEREPAVVNLWQTGYGPWARVSAGDLILLKRRGSVEDVIGYGTAYCRFPAYASTVWERYGSGNGVSDEDEFKEQIAYRRTKHTVTDPVIGNIVIHDLILFRDRPFKLHQQSSVPSGHHPLTPLDTPLCEALARQLATHMISTHLEEGRATVTPADRYDARFNAWEDGVKAAYGWCCAVSKIRARDLLRVVAIRPLDLDGPLDVSNGLLLELDRAELYAKRLITFHVNGALLVSPDLALEDPSLYRRIAGEPLRLPKSLNEQPASDLVAWRLQQWFKR